MEKDNGMIIGITGGVGCGKSTVLGILEKDFQCFVIEADKVGHMLMKSGEEVFLQIVALFGRDILDSKGEIDRKKLGSIVFSDKEKLTKLNKIVHPAVKEAIKKQIKEVRNKKKDAIIVIEAALLIEDHYGEICDEFWYIYAEDEVRFLRLKNSRGYTMEKINEITASQLSKEEFTRHCRRVIDNSCDLEYTYAQIKSNIMQISEENNGKSE